MRKKFKKTLRELTKEVVEIVNNESSDYDAEEKVLEHLSYHLLLDKDYGINVDFEIKEENG